MITQNPKSRFWQTMTHHTRGTPNRFRYHGRVCVAIFHTHSPFFLSSLHCSIVLVRQCSFVLMFKSSGFLYTSGASCTHSALFYTWVLQIIPKLLGIAVWQSHSKHVFSMAATHPPQLSKHPPCKNSTPHQKIFCVENCAHLPRGCILW